MQGWIYSSDACGKLSERGPRFFTCYTEILFDESRLNFLFCLEIYFFVSPFHIVNRLKSFDFKLFFVYIL